MILKALKLKDNLKNLVDKFKIFNNSSGYLVLLVIFTGLVAGAGFKVLPIGSQGVDPATPLNNDTIAQINEAHAAGADSVKVLIYDNRPDLLTSAINRAYELGMSFYARNAGNFSGTDFASILNTGVSGSRYANSLGNDFYVSLYNEPEYDEEKADIEVAENWVSFYRNLQNDQILISPYIPNINLTAPAKNGEVWWEYFSKVMTKIAELGGQEAINKIDFMGINAHGDVAVDIQSALSVFGLFMNNPQILLAETSPSGGTKESFEAGLRLCQVTPNCIGAYFFNALFDAGKYNTDWAAYKGNLSDEGLKNVILSMIGNYAITNEYNQQTFNQDFILYTKYLFDPSSLSAEELERAVAFYNLLASTFAQVIANYKNLGSVSTYGVSATISSLSCGNGNMTYGYNIINSDNVTFVHHAKWHAAYQLLDNSGKPVGGIVDLGGSPTQSSQFAGPGKEINLQPGMEDNLNHDVNYSPIISGGSIKFFLNTGFENNASNAQADPNKDKLTVNNECIVKILPGGQCSSIVCTGGGPAMYCVAANDSVRSPAPKKPNVDMNPVMACNEQSATGENTLRLSHTKLDAPVGVHNFRLGFEIQNMQLAYPLSDNRGADFMLENTKFEDNTPPRIAKRLATQTMKSNKDPGYINASFSNWNLIINKVNKSIDYPAGSADAGVDYLEYIFENICYIANSQSSATACLKIFRDFQDELTSGSYNYNIPADYVDLKDNQVLSCSQEYNNKEFSGKYSENYNARGYGSYIINDFPVDVEPFAPGLSKGILEVSAIANVNLAVSRVNWMISGLFSLENGFMSRYFDPPEMFQKYYDNCLVKYIDKDGGAAKINYRFVLEERQELQCEPWQIRPAGDQYQWKRVKTSSSGSSYVPGLGALYLFLSHLPEEALGTKSTAGLTYRFDPENPDSCQLVYQNFLPNIQVGP